MRLLLDTHALLWWLSNNRQLGTHARELVADPGNDVLVSAVSLWEIVVKVRSGKLDTNIEEVMAATERDRFMFLNIKPAHLLSLNTLPMHHRDPFDHLLMAQALAEDATFLSTDRHVPDHPVRSIDCAI